MLEKEYLKTSIILNAFGVDFQEVENSIGTIYNSSDIKSYTEALQNSEFSALDNLIKVRMLTEWQQSYGSKFYGKTQAERECLKAKEEAYELIEKICESGNVCLETWFSKLDISIVKTTIGMIFYYNLLGFNNKEYGESLIKASANENEINALLWCLEKTTEKEKYLTKLFNTSKIKSSPVIQKELEEKYDIKLKSFERSIKTPIGFTWEEKNV